MLAAMGCGAFGQRTYKHITVIQADSLINSKLDSSLVILDVRTPAEFEKGHLQNAVLVNFLKRGFRKNLSKLDKEKTYLVYCRTGGRSAKTLKKMKRRRFREAYNMLGGIRDWTNRGYDIVVNEKKN